MEGYTILVVDYLNHGIFTPIKATSGVHAGVLLERIDRIFKANGFYLTEDEYPNAFERYYELGAGGLELRVFCIPERSGGHLLTSDQNPRKCLEELAQACGLDLDTLLPV